VSIRVAGPADARALAALRAVWSGGDEPEFAARMAAWLTSEGDRRTTWLATKADEPVGMASMLEYRRMPRPGRPDSRWGYVSNMFVREDARDDGIGTALLEAIIATAEERGYVRLVLSPSVRSVPFYERAGFVVPDEHAGDHRLLVRPS
jgi:GNAT superfamily N-acetyltransferase